MAILPNWRNASGTQCPPLFTDTSGAYQVGVLIKYSDWHILTFKRSLTTGQLLTSKDLGTVGALVTYGITPIKSDALGGDVHYACCCALDDRNRMWVAGNSLAETPHLIRTNVSADAGLNGWTTFTWPYPGFNATTGGAFCTYQNFQRLSTGELILHIDQRESSGAAEGKDNLAYYLPLGSDTWTPLVGTGELLTSEATTPNRIYLTGIFTELTPHKDRVWISYVWRQDWTDVTTSVEPGILYNDTVFNENTWKRIDGTSQPMPVTYANTTGTSATIPLPSGHTYWYSTGQISIDFNGHPHLVTGPGGVNRHVWHDGSAWQVENIATTATTPAPFTLANGNTLIYREFQNRVRVSKMASGSPAFDLGNPVPSNWDQPYADPVQLSQGKLHLLVPNGDIPEVYTVGDPAGIH